jgi:tetratricopeptide (TPR) repeat protein
VAKASDSTLQQALARAEDAQLIYRYGKPPESHYVFKHALIQDAAYSSLLKKSRQQYHEHVARTLLEQFPETAEAQPELLAVHYDAAGDAATAIHYWLQAGKRALERDANREAIAQLDAALASLERLPKGGETSKLELTIQLAIMPAHMAVHGWPSRELEICCLRARDLSIQLSDHQNLYGSSWGLWSVHFLRGEQDEALEIAGQVFAMAKAAGAPMLEVTARHAVGFTHYMRTEYREALEHAERGMALFDLETERVLVGLFQLSSSMVLRSYRAAIEWLSGKMDDARQSQDSAIRLARELNHTPSMALALGWGMYHHHFWRDIDLMRATALELMPLSEEKGFLFWMPQARMFLGWTEVQTGDADAGLSLFRRGLAEVRASGARMLLVQENVLLAEALRKVGRNAEALDALEEAIACATSWGRDVSLPEAYRLRGELRLAAGDEQGACTDFDQALRIAHAQPALSLELRASVSKAGMLHNQGRQDDALLLVEPIYNQFTQGFNTPDLQDARLLMARSRETAGRTMGTSL